MFVVLVPELDKKIIDMGTMYFVMSRVAFVS